MSEVLSLGMMIRSVRIHHQVFSGLDQQQMIDRLQGEVRYLRKRLGRQDDSFSEAPTLCADDGMSEQQCLSDEEREQEELMEQVENQRVMIQDALCFERGVNNKQRNAEGVRGACGDDD